MEPKDKVRSPHKGRRPKPQLRTGALDFANMFRTPRYLAIRWQQAFGYWPSMRRLRREVARLRDR